MSAPLHRLAVVEARDQGTDYHTVDLEDVLGEVQLHDFVGVVAALGPQFHVSFVDLDEPFDRDFVTDRGLPAGDRSAPASSVSPQARTPHSVCQLQPNV